MSRQAVSFGYTNSEINNLEALLSRERFAGYMRLAAGDRYRAVRLYERNASLSAAIHEVIQYLEIPLRNAIDLVMVKPHSPLWFETLPLLSYPLPNMVADAKAKLSEEVQKGRKAQITRGDMIVELPFGFWTALLSSRYEKTLWVPVLHKAFPNAIKATTTRAGQTKTYRLGRNDIAKRFDRIRRLRNRVAHHEPILRWDIKEQHADILDAISWLCPVTAQWATLNSKFLARHAEPI